MITPWKIELVLVRDDVFANDWPLDAMTTVNEA